ncbi:MAG: hypothetical protein Q8K59_13145 [Nitrosomonas sp.]|nr:hypothetical protein [Nitrosomonas sp.]MDP1952004.1 hypothetical protein [Nitrosomonas sp.]
MIESPQAMLAQAEDNNETAHTRQHREELNNHPEVQAQITELLRKHYRQWPQEKLPALNSKTPLQIIKNQNWPGNGRSPAAGLN